MPRRFKNESFVSPHIDPRMPKWLKVVLYALAGAAGLLAGAWRCGYLG